VIPEQQLRHLAQREVTLAALSIERAVVLIAEAGTALQTLVANTKEVVSTSVYRSEPMNFRFTDIHIRKLRGQTWVDADCFSKNSSKHYHETIYFYHGKSTANFNTTPVRVSCGCKAYYFYFEHWNVSAGCHARRERIPYVRKTPPPPEGRPYINPQHLPGMCKHLMALADVLMNSGEVSIALTGTPAAARSKSRPQNAEPSTSISPSKKAL